MRENPPYGILEGEGGNMPASQVRPPRRLMDIGLYPASDSAMRLPPTRQLTAIGGMEAGLFRPAWILSEHPSCLLAVFSCQGARLRLHQVSPSYNAILAVRDGGRAELWANAL